jgi:hypothetical protein
MRTPRHPRRHVIRYRAAAQVNAPLTQRVAPPAWPAWARAIGVVAFGAVVVTGVSLHVRAVQHETAAKERAAAEAAEIERRNCRILTRALDVVGYQRHRPELLDVKDGDTPCQRAAYDCPYTVDVVLELLAADRADLAAEVEGAYVTQLDCVEDLRFAKAHGRAAFADYRQRVDAMFDHFFTLYGPAIRAWERWGDR